MVFGRIGETKYYRYPPYFSGLDWMASLIGNVLGILICGSLGGVVAWAIVGMLGLAGAYGAIVAAVIGMVVAVAAWAAGSVALRAAGWIK